MNVLFLGSLCPPSLYKECVSRNIPIDNAGLTLQKALVESFSITEKITSVSVPSILSMRKIFIKKYKDEYKHNNRNITIPFINIPGIKQILTPYFSTYYLNKNNITDVDVIFIYSVQSHWLKVAYYLKKRYPKCKVIMMVTDLPEFMSSSQNRVYRSLKNIESDIVNKYMSVVDGFILLSEYMTEKLPVMNKPYLVIEGIWHGKQQAYLRVDKSDSQNRTILYTGTLAMRYGIKNLIDAFLLILNDHYRLLICGKGDGEDYLKKAITRDKRISYLGQLTRDKVVELQSKVDLLINPRGPEGEYTRYSFPSKTIEYLASGTPALICRLPAIPNEYYNYCFSVTNTNVDTLKNKIEEVFKLSKDDLKEMGCKAQKFIKENKSINKQSAKILDFIKLI